MPTLKKFLHYYKPHKAMLIFDLICATVVSLVDISFPQILNVLNKSLFTMDATVILHTIGFVAIGLIVMYLIKLFCDYFIATWGHIMGSRMESAMRSDLFDKMQRLPFSYYDKNNTGEMMTKMVSDLFDISEVAHHGPENLFLAFLKLIGSFVLLMMVHVPLTLILFAVVIIMCIFSVFQNKRMKKAFSDNNKKIANINAQLQDSLAGIRVVKSFANETVEKEKFQKANVSFLSSKKHSYHAYGRFQSGNLYFQGILFTVILVFGGIFIAQGTLNAPDLALYALYINIFINPITILVNFMEIFQKGMAGFSRFLEIMETPIEIKDKPNAPDLNDVKGTIQYQHVFFSYDGVHNVLNDIDFEIPAGKTIALVGPSGGGKSTICALLPRFYDVSEGSISIDGTDIRDVTQKSLRKAIGVVQQDIYNNLTDIPKDDEFKEDVALIENWDEDAKVPELSSEFKTTRSIRIININPDEIEKALNEFDNVVNNIESSLIKEIKGCKIQDAWKAQGDERTCDACDFKTFCKNKKTKTKEFTIP